MEVIVNADLIGSEDEADLSSWFVADGESVAEGQPIGQLETSKVQVQVDAPASGTISLRAAAGAVVTAGTIIATID